MVSLETLLHFSLQWLSFELFSASAFNGSHLNSSPLQSFSYLVKIKIKKWIDYPMTNCCLYGTLSPLQTFKVLILVIFSDVFLTSVG